MRRGMAVRFAGASGGCGAVLRKTIGMRSAIGLRHPASASCLGRHLRLAGRCPNNSSLFPPLAAVVVVVLCAYSAEKLLIIEQCRAVCGPPGIAFSRVGSWRKTASAALVSCGNSRAVGRTLSSSRRSPVVPLSGFAIFPPDRGGSRSTQGKLFAICWSARTKLPPSGKLARERLRGFALSLWESWHRIAMTERARMLTVCSSAGSLFPLTSPLFCTIILQK